MERVKAGTIAVSGVISLCFVLSMFDNPNIRISPVRKIRHSKQKGNSDLLGVSMEEELNTRRISGGLLSRRVSPSAILSRR
jgi:hypothetical protein